MNDIRPLRNLWKFKNQSVALLQDTQENIWFSGPEIAKILGYTTTQARTQAILKNVSDIYKTIYQNFEGIYLSVFF